MQVTKWSAKHCNEFKPVCKRERERFTLCIQPAWLMRTGLCSCLSPLQQGNETMADRLLVLVPHEQTHAPAASWNRPGNWALMSLKRGQSNTQRSSSPTACVPQTVHRRRWRGTAGLAERPCSIVSAAALMASLSRKILDPPGEHGNR